MTTALEGGEGSASRSLPSGKTRYQLYRRLGGNPGPVWTGAENLAPTVIRSPNRPARSQSLYRLCYPAHSWKLEAPYVTSMIYRQRWVWQSDKHFCRQTWNDTSWRLATTVVCNHATRLVSSGSTVQSR